MQRNWWRGEGNQHKSNKLGVTAIQFICCCPQLLLNAFSRMYFFLFFSVENLLPDSTGYEFRVWATSLLSGLRSARPSSISDPIRLRPPQSAAHQHITNGTSGPQLEWSQLANAPPSSSSSRRPPEKPSPPEYIGKRVGNTFLDWMNCLSPLQTTRAAIS
jgi:hypothetical protein